MRCSAIDKLKINWVDQVSNDQVQQQVNEQKTIIDTIKARTFRWLEHTLRHDSATQVVLEGIIPGKKGKKLLRANYIP